MLCGLLIDIDDMLMVDGCIEFVVLVVLQWLYDVGILVIVIIGWLVGWSELFVCIWLLVVIVVENGVVMLWCVGEGVCYDFIVDELICVVNFQCLQVCVVDVLVCVFGVMFVIDSFGWLIDIVIDYSEFVYLDVVQIVIVCVVMCEYGLQVMVSFIYINGWIGEYSKWIVVCWVVEMVLVLLFCLQELFYVGDLMNDEMMFECILLFVGVVNIVCFVLWMCYLFVYVMWGVCGEGFVEVVVVLFVVQEQLYLFQFFGECEFECCVFGLGVDEVQFVFQLVFVQLQIGLVEYFFVLQQWQCVVVYFVFFCWYVGFEFVFLVLQCFEVVLVLDDGVEGCQQVQFFVGGVVLGVWVFVGGLVLGLVVDECMCVVCFCGFVEGVLCFGVQVWYVVVEQVCQVVEVG